MFLHLIFRGISRHTKKGKWLFVLIAMSAASIVFLYTMKSSFITQYRDFNIDTGSGHLQIISPDSAILKEGFQALFNPSTIPLVKIDQATMDYVESIEEVEVAGRIIDTWVSSYNLDSQPEDSYRLIGVSASLRRTLFPRNQILEGSDDIHWESSMTEAALIRPSLRDWQINNNKNVAFRLGNLLVSGKALESFKKIIVADFPTLFTRPDYSGEERNTDFLSDWNATLKRTDLASLVNEPFSYNWQLDDALTALRENKDPEMLAFFNNRVFKALYPNAVGYLLEPVRIGKSVSIQIASAEVGGNNSIPAVVPARYTGYVEGVSAFIDIFALQEYLGLEPEECLSCMIRVKDINEAKQVKHKISAYLQGRGLPLVVVDYKILGKHLEATSQAVEILISVMIALLTAIVGLLIGNMVSFSVIARRREMGTSIALGMSPSENIIIMLGEVFLLVNLSCIFAFIIAFISVKLFAYVGIPGFMFFLDNKLFLIPEFSAYIKMFFIINSIVLLASLGPLLPLRRLMPVEMLKEESR